MSRLLFSWLLCVLLLFQAGKAPLLLHWQQLARESFAQLFCENIDQETVPMCYGSCQVDQLFAEVVAQEHREGIHAVNVLPEASTYCLFPALTAWHTPENPITVSRKRPVFLPSRYCGDFSGESWHPPTASAGNTVS